MKHKRLAILRHGPVSLQTSGSLDHENPLREDAHLHVAESLKILSRVDNFIPHAAMSSDAKRCLQTLALVEDHFDLHSKVTIVPAFYHASCQDVFDALMSLEESTESVILLGHNPTWSQLITELSGHYLGLPPAGLAVLALNTRQPWVEALAENSWELQASSLPGHVH